MSLLHYRSDKFFKKKYILLIEEFLLNNWSESFKAQHLKHMKIRIRLEKGLFMSCLGYTYFSRKLFRPDITVSLRPALEALEFFKEFGYTEDGMLLFIIFHELGHLIDIYNDFAVFRPTLRSEDDDTSINDLELEIRATRYAVEFLEDHGLIPELEFSFYENLHRDSFVPNN